MASTDIGIDLGTASILVYVKGKGVVLKEPSVVAYDKDSDRIKAIGEEARQMIGRTPGNIMAIRPLRKGVISDYTITERMLKYFIQKAMGRRAFRKPRISICVPSGVTEDEAIIRYVRKAHNLFIGEQTAEAVKIRLGSVYPRPQTETMEIKGRNVITGLPKTAVLTSEEIREALKDVMGQILEAIHSVLEKTPPELAADVVERGIVLTGGGALLRGLEELIGEHTGINTMTAENPACAVAVGTGEYADMMARLEG